MLTVVMDVSKVRIVSSIAYSCSEAAAESTGL